MSSNSAKSDSGSSESVSLSSTGPPFSTTIETSAQCSQCSQCHQLQPCGTCEKCESCACGCSAPPQQCCLPAEPTKCLYDNTFTCDVEDGVWQGGMGIGTQPLRVGNCFSMSANGDWFPITPRVAWGARRKPIDQCCACAADCSWIDPMPWRPSPTCAARNCGSGQTQFCSMNWCDKQRFGCPVDNCAPPPCSEYSLVPIGRRSDESCDSLSEQSECDSAQAACASDTHPIDDDNSVRFRHDCSATWRANRFTARQRYVGRPLSESYDMKKSAPVSAARCRTASFAPPRSVAPVAGTRFTGSGAACHCGIVKDRNGQIAIQRTAICRGEWDY